VILNHIAIELLLVKLDEKRINLTQNYFNLLIFEINLPWQVMFQKKDGLFVY